MKIDKTIKEAIEKAVEKAGSQSALSRRTGISSQNICRYLSGRITELSPVSFAKLWGEIVPYLPDGYEETYKSEIEKLYFSLAKQNARKLKISPLVRVGLKAEAERQVMEEAARYGTKSDQDADHRAEILQLKLDHAERERELMGKIVELTNKLLKDKED